MCHLVLHIVPIGFVTFQSTECCDIVAEYCQCGLFVFWIILASVLAKNVTYCTNSTKLDKISVRMARTQPGCVGKFSVFVLILMFTKQKILNLSAQLLTVLFGRQPICTTANFFSRGGSDRPYFLTFLARTQASMIWINTLNIFFKKSLTKILGIHLKD